MATNLASEFAGVIACTRCTRETSAKLQRDADENIPQPGYVGDSGTSRFACSRSRGRQPVECLPGTTALRRRLRCITSLDS